MENKNFTDYYINKQLEFDKKLIRYRYKTNKPFFRGTICLELGPAEGIMTKLLVNDFEQIDIVDGDRDLLNLIPDYSNVEKFHSWFEEFTPPRKYDTIIMEHIIEHLAEPGVVLKKVREWLKPDGVLIAGVPNAKSYHRLAAVKMGLLKSEYELNDRDKTQGHYRVYDLTTFSQEFLDCNYNIINTTGIFFKPLSNGQIDSQWTDEMIEAFYELGKDFPEYCASIHLVCEKE